MKPRRFSCSDGFIKKTFLTNGDKSLVIAQGNFPNCLFISFFISFAQVNIRFQKKFLTKTIIPCEKDGQRGFYVRKFVPHQLSEEFRFIALSDMNNVLAQETSYETLLWPHNGGKEVGTINMSGPLLMRIIEYSRILDMKNESLGRIGAVQVIDYLKNCGINGETAIIEGMSGRSNFSKCLQDKCGWIGRVKFTSELVDNEGRLLTDKHAYSILSINEQMLSIANPRYYNSKDKRTIIEVDFETRGLSGFIYEFKE